MNSKTIKLLFVCGLLLTATIWLTSKSSSQSAKSADQSSNTVKTQPINYNPNDYVGSDACKDCHEDQFKAFLHTAHAQLTKISSWKGKVTGCEACHGPGKAHIDELAGTV